MNHSLSKLALLAALALSISAHSLAQKATHTFPTGSAIDAEVKQVMARTHASGLAIALIDHGKVGYVQAYGIRNAKGEPLTTDTVMYGASLTKMVFSYHVLQLVDQGKVKLDTPFKDDFDKPLIEYGAHSDQKFLGK
jgi:CubicO group peptidase (beta-lactamase class C family)